MSKIKDLLKKDVPKTYTGSEVDQALQQSNPYALKEAIAEIHRDGGGIVQVMKKDTKSAGPGRKGEVDIAEAYEDENFLDTIQAKYKDGLYVFRLFKEDGEKGKFQSDHIFLLGEMPDPKEKSKKKKKKKGKQGSLSDRLVETLVLAAVDKNNNNGALQIKDVLQMQQHGFDKAIELMQASQGGGGGGSEVISAFMEGFQLRGDVQPQIEREEPLTAIVQSVMPVLGGLLAAKGGGNVPQPQDLEAEVRRRLAAAVAGAGAAHGTVSGPAPPGGSGLGSAGEAATPGTGAPDPSPVPGTHEFFEHRFIAPFRRSVADGHPDAELAYQIIAMNQYTRDRMPDNPHPLVKDFIMAASLPEYENALSAFWAAIPEISSLTQKQVSIHAELVKMLMSNPLPAEPVPPVQEEAAVEITDEPDSDTSGQPDISGQPEIEEGTGHEDQSDSAEASPELQDENVSS